MPIFQNSVISKYLKAQDKNLVAKRWNDYKNHFHNTTIQDNIRKSKEEQYQGEFLIDLFVAILGYTKNPQPNFNLTSEYKNVKDSKKADGAILIDDKVRAVIELKGTNTTDLGKIETQAFGYKNNQPDCIYIITSNFEKLRFYIDNAIEHLEFNLFTLSEKEFELLHLCLAYENLSKGIAKTIKEESVSQEDVITKKLYKDYSVFKRELYHNMVSLNPEYEPIELFKKSQKLLDRFLFIFFAEDRNLLPTNLIFRINKEWQNLRLMRIEVSLYDRYKVYFNDLNNGAKVVLPAFSQTASKQIEEHQIFAYNGGLFKADEILDNIKIDDSVLFKHTENLSNYDFASEVDVNILGHIFENSLNELDEIKAELEGQVIDRTKTKRKKDGVFYTPKYITKYIVENTIGKLCNEKKIELQLNEEDYTTDKKRQKKTLQGLVDKLQRYRNWLLQLTICDPACGSGAFLNQALDFLINEHRYIDELQAKLFGDAMVLSDVENSILENNLFGVDLNEESVEIAKLSLWLRTAQPNRKLNDLSNNIKCGNSLIDDVEIAKEKAFNWHTAFPHVFENGGFDVVIGNPPYGVSFNESEKKYLQTYDDLVPDFEIYIYFISLYKTILKKDSLLSYIFPNTFLSTLFGKKYRDFIFNNLEVYQIIDLSNDNTFVDASVRTCIFSFKNCISEKPTELIKIENSEFKVFQIYSKENIIKETENILGLFYQNKEEKNIIQKLQKNKFLKEYYEVSQGLIPYDKYRGHDEFTIKNRIWHSDFCKDDTYKKELKGGDVNRYNINWNGKLWISYGDWLAAPRKQKFFTSKRILIREISSDKLFCGYTEDEYYNTPSAINIIDEKGILDLKYSLTILNSKLIGWLHNKVSPKANKGLFPKILINDVKVIPIAFSKNEDQQHFIEKADKMLTLNEELHQQSQKFQRNLQREFNLEILPNKLQIWYELKYADFIKELEKIKVKLTLLQKSEWEDYFTAEATKLNIIKEQIEITDKEIDSMVYELYGLTKEEIEIVENS
jgi:type I restriction-modification system DNA methylase subunit